MEHILKKSHHELERTHRLVNTYKTSGPREVFFSIFGKSFKKALGKYAEKKEEILLRYGSLHSDIQKDVKGSKALPTDVEHVRGEIMNLTEDIEKCGIYLEHLIAHSHRQEEIVHEEKLFFTHLLESFNTDLLDWVGSHEKQVFGEVSTIGEESEGNPLEKGKKLLLIQKKKLESHMKSI